MSDIIEEGQATPIEAPADTAAPADDFDALINEFDRGVAQLEPEPAIGVEQPAVENAAAPPDQTFEQNLADILGPDPRVAELQGQVNSLRAQEHRRQELEAFDKFASDLQQDMPSWVPADYTRAKLEALAHDPQLALAWDLRNVDRNAANLELQRVRIALAQTTDPARINELQQYGARLQVAVNSHAILRKATLGVLNDAKKLAPPIDEETTADRNAVAVAVRDGGSGRATPAEPPPNLGGMDSQEYRRYIKSKYGFDAGI